MLFDFFISHFGLRRCLSYSFMTCLSLSRVNVCEHSLFRFVFFKLRNCGHLALSSCLTLRAKHYNYVWLYWRPVCQSFVFYCNSAVLHGSLFGVCHCYELHRVNLISIKGIIILLLLLLLSVWSGFLEHHWKDIQVAKRPGCQTSWYLAFLFLCTFVPGSEKSIERTFAPVEL